MTVALPDAKLALMNEEKNRRGRKSRIDEKAWLEAALRVLADGGVDAVRVESVSRMLGVTKGSFYKRFANRDALLVAMLEYWRRESTYSVIETFSNIEEPPADKLDRILALSKRRPDVRDRARMELAIRLWGHKDDRAAETMAEVDNIRLQYFVSVFESNGFNPSEAEGRAFLTYAFGVLDAVMQGSRSAETLEKCKAIISSGRPADG